MNRQRCARRSWAATDRIQRAIGACLCAWLCAGSAITSHAVGDIIVVSPGESIQAAIDIANSGDEILVEPGTYNQLINLLGKAIELRSTSGPDVTTIDGAGLADTVVRCVTSETADTRIEGFTITGGESTTSGGGMLNDASSPTVHNCIFINNIVTGFDAGGGGAMANINGAGPTVTNCTFDNNGADGFKVGAGMFSAGGAPTVTDCTFINNLNEGFEGGGGLYNLNADAIITGCTFGANACTVTDSGGGAYNQGASPQFIDCTFTNNTAGNAGAILNAGGSPLVFDCTFTGNITTNTAGALRNTSGTTARIDSCTFTDNASEIGGAVDNSSASLAMFVNCVFRANEAEFAGGMRNFDASPLVVNCTFDSNVGTVNGGGMRNTGGSPTVVNCLFVENTSATVGGAIRNVSGSAPNIINSTFVRNDAGESGGGIYSLASDPVITGCILWNNSDAGGMDESAQIHISSGTTTVNYSCVQGGWSGPGSNNIGADPSFVNAARSDFSLSAGSPCIDAADNTAVPSDAADLDDDDDVIELTPLDLLGAARFVDDPDTADTGAGGAPIVDMGALEYQPPSCTGDINTDGVVNASDLAILLGNWGPVPPGDADADLNNDNNVDPADLAILLGNWGACR